MYQIIIPILCVCSFYCGYIYYTTKKIIDFENWSNENWIVETWIEMDIV